MSSKRRMDVSAQTMLNKIEKDVKDFIPQVPYNLKSKVINIHEAVKLLSRKINGNNNNSLLIDNNNDNKSQANTSYDYKSCYKQINASCGFSNRDASYIFPGDKDKQINNLQSENDNLKKQIKVLESNVDRFANKEKISQDNTTQYKYILKEEQNNKKMLLLQIRNLESDYKELTEKYNNEIKEKEKLLNDLSNLSKINSDLKRVKTETKYNYTDILKVNCDLRNKLTKYELAMKNHVDEIKKEIVKNNKLKDKIKELETLNEKLVLDLSNREDRLNAVRKMNNQLEKKSNSLIKKFECIANMEELNNNMNDTVNKANSNIESLNQKIEDEKFKNQILIEKNQKLEIENDQLYKDNINIKDEIKTLKYINYQLNEKCKNFEAYFKNSIEQLSENTSSNFKINSNIDNNQSINIDNLKPAVLSSL